MNNDVKYIVIFTNCYLYVCHFGEYKVGEGLPNRHSSSTCRAYQAFDWLLSYCSARTNLMITSSKSTHTCNSYIALKKYIL